MEPSAPDRPLTPTPLGNSSRSSEVQQKSSDENIFDFLKGNDRLPSPKSGNIKPFLDMNIMYARDCAICDIVSSDPYMIVKFKDMWYRTSAVQSSLNPNWNEDVTFPLYGQDMNEYIEFLVWDEDQGSKDDFMGSYKIRLRDLLSQMRESEGKPLTFQLGNPHGIKLKTKITGSFTIAAENNNKGEGMFKRYGSYFCDEYPFRVKAGDILLFHHSRINGVLIETLTNSSWCHVGIISEDEAGFCLLDATSNGVDHTDLQSALKCWSEYISDITFGIVRLSNLDSNEMEALRVSILAFFEKHKHTKYEREIGQLIKGALNANLKEDHSSLFCSELVAGCLQEAQILSSKRLSNNFMPGDFSNHKMLQKLALKGKYESVKHIHWKCQNLPKSYLRDSKTKTG